MRFGVAVRRGWEDSQVQPPDAAVIMLQTRTLNRWLGTSYRLDEVAAMDPLTFDILAALNRGLFPPEPKVHGKT